MADKDSEDKPSLELPSFGFGRKKGKDKAPEPTPEPEPTPSVPQQPPTPPAPVPPAAPVPPPAPVPPQAKTDASSSPTQDTMRIPSRPAARVAPAAVGSTRSTATSPVASASEEEEEDGSSTESKTRRSFALPTIGAFPTIPALRAVLIVGAVVGLLAVLLTFSSLKFCELVRGTDSCGGPGVLLLLATVVLLTYVGAWLLRGFGVAEAGSMSFLAVALLAVMVMVFFLGVIYNWWMVLVIPPVSMAMYALSWWVTTRLVEDDTRRDVRPR